MDLTKKILDFISGLIEHALLLSVASFALGLSALDLFGYINATSVFGRSIESILVLLLSSLCLYIMAERHKLRSSIKKLNSDQIEDIKYLIEKETNILLEAQKGLQFRHFTSTEAQMKYQTKKIQAAKNKIEDLTWSHKLSKKVNLPSRKKVENEYENALTEASSRIYYREIFIFNKQSRLEKLKRRLKENKPGYACAYYQDTKVPRMQFMIIDEEEVIFASSGLPIRCALKHKQFAKAIAEYYETVWENATPIKDGNEIFLSYDQVKESLD